MKAKCSCGEKSLPGLSSPVCAFKWAEGNWGLEWARKCYPNHPHDIKK